MLSCALLCSPGLSWALLGSPGLSWALLGHPGLHSHTLSEGTRRQLGCH